MEGYPDIRPECKQFFSRIEGIATEALSMAKRVDERQTTTEIALAGLRTSMDNQADAIDRLRATLDRLSWLLITTLIGMVASLIGVVFWYITNM